MKRKNYVMLTIAVILAILAVQYVLAAPQGPTTVAVENNQQAVRGNTGVGIEAQAGNVSRLDLNDSRITDHWQGYYGNITGEITLDSPDNQTFFSWQFVSTQGEVFASNTSSVTWANVVCVNLSGNPDNDPQEDSGVNSSMLEGHYGILPTEVDGFNETYTTLFSGSFDVGSVTIDDTDGCYQAFPYQNNASQSSVFENVLLTTNTSLIFTALIDPAVGFNGQQLDFQIILAENGSSNEATTTYYFFVELS